MRDSVVIALDVDDAAQALDLGRVLKGHVKWVKVGMTLFYTEGPGIVRDLRAMGFKVFVDLKLNDIPHQIRGACRTLVRVGADMFTVHASGGRAMLEAAVAETADVAAKFGVPRPVIVAVTVLTSLDDAALEDLGWPADAHGQVVRLAKLADACGCDGVVCSPDEAADVRGMLGPDAVIVTPGVRPSWAEAADQARVATPADARAAGASYLVIGRPVTAATDPVAAVRRILEEGDS